MCLWSRALLYACITLRYVTKEQPDLLYTEESRPARLPVIAGSTLPDGPALLIFSAASASSAQHQAPITTAILLQVQHARLLRNRLQAS